MTKHVVFDFDGIIANSNKDKIKVLSKILSKTFNYPEKYISNLLLKSLPGLNRSLYIEILKKITNKKINKKKLLKLINVKMLDMFRKVKINPYIKNMREHKENVYWYIITSGCKKEVIFFLNKHKISNYFRSIVGGTGEKYLSFLILKKKYKIDNKNLMVIGDSLKDLELIKKLSCQGFLVTEWSQEANFLSLVRFPNIKILKKLKELKLVYKSHFN